MSSGERPPSAMAAYCDLWASTVDAARLDMDMLRSCRQIAILDEGKVAPPEADRTRRRVRRYPSSRPQGSKVLRILFYTY